MKYIPFIVIDGKEFEVITEDIACTKEEAIEFCSGMVKCDKINYVTTKQGIFLISQKKYNPFTISVNLI